MARGWLWRMRMGMTSLKEGKHSKNLRILILFFSGEGFDHLLFFLISGVFLADLIMIYDWWPACERTGKEKGEWLGQQFGVWTLPTQVKSCFNRQICWACQKFNPPKTPGWFQLETGHLYLLVFRRYENLHQISHMWICQASMVGMRPLAASSGWSSGVVSAGNWNHWQFATWNWRGRVEIYLWPRGPDVSRKFVEKVVSGGVLLFGFFLGL